MLPGVRLGTPPHSTAIDAPCAAVAKSVVAQTPASDQHTAVCSAMSSGVLLAVLLDHCYS